MISAKKYSLAKR